MSLHPNRPGDSGDDLREGVRAGDRRSLARAITLLESTRADRHAEAQAILEALVPYTGGAVRVGITGPPGVGKSTFIESLGLALVEQGHRVAVLAVDPSSPVSGGSILGDKTRMEELAHHPNAFIRPSPSGGSLGGVAHRTRECLLLCEAAGFDVVLVETVGIGQSEVKVASMVDFFLVLLLPGGGDELQGIKKGVMELADALVVNKADGDSLAAAERTRVDYTQALQLIRSSTPAWTPVALQASARDRVGIDAVWSTILDHRQRLEAAGELERRRREQTRAWLWTLVEEGLQTAFRAHPGVAAEIPDLERDVEALKTTPAAAARKLLAIFRSTDAEG
ncbi:MAG: methylmalonyl Co-A mutase-associated GTPase MeaB [Proteobacteria bacterium]|nr:methylmalonyl Co-A mutase-associated GTPase MeaB [Pseudomonadota bacterium]